MKKYLSLMLTITVIGSMLSSCASSGYVTQAPAYQDPGPITYQSFYDNLSPYGTWIDYPGYGNVWNPNAGRGFRPYATNGQWRYSNEGWAWQSNYNWGWAPFHYGRWLYDDSYGWLWVPGYDWSPAWVTWGSVDNYYAWAPLMPEVNVGAQYGNWRPHSSYWNVVPREHVYDRNISNVIVHYDHNNNTNINSNNNNNNTIITNNNITKNITIINNYNTSRTNNYYAKGPDVGEVERYTGNRIQPVSFREVNQIHRPAQNGNVMEVYRPVVQDPHPQNAAPRPQQNYNQGNYNQTNNNQNNPFNQPRGTQNNSGELVTPVPQNHQQHLDTRGNDPVRPAYNNSNNAGNTPPNLPQQNNNNQHPQQAQNQPRPQDQPHPQLQEPPHPQAQLQVQNAPPMQNNNHPQNQPAIQRPPQQNQTPPQNNAQPRMFRRADPTQTRPINSNSADPVLQPTQQRRNIQQLPIQRPSPAPVNNNNGGNNGSNNGGRREGRPQ